MTAIAERIGVFTRQDLTGRENQREQPWSLPEKLPGTNVALKTSVGENTKGLTSEEMTRAHMGVVEVARWFVNGHKNEKALLWGFDIQRDEEPDVFTVTHQESIGQTKVEARIRRGYGQIETSEFELFDASVELSFVQRAGRFLHSIFRNN